MIVFKDLNSLSFLFKTAKKSIALKNCSEGLAALKKAEEMISSADFPKHLKCENFFQLASLFQALGLKQSALKYLKGVLKMTSSFTVAAKAHLNIAYIMGLQGLHQKAIFHNSKALELLKNSEEYEGIVSAYHGLGLSYQKLGQVSKSISSFKDGLMISKNYLGTNHKLTKILRNLYLDLTKNVSFLEITEPVLTNSEIIKIFNQSQTPTPKTSAVLPKYLSKSTSPVPKAKVVLTRSVQCNTEDTLSPQFLSSSQFRYPQGSRLLASIKYNCCFNKLNAK